MDKNNLINFFIDSAKEENEFGIGTEHEKFIFTLNDKKRIPFKGKVSIETLFTFLLTRGWMPGELSEGNLISLNRDGASVTLEPGGQLELSGKIQKNIHQTCHEMHFHLEELKIYLNENDLFMIGLGFDPITKIQDIEWIPKERYSIMKSYMPIVGNRGLDMMTRTCTVQANFDYKSEIDLIRKFVVANRIQSFVMAMFSNSPFLEKINNGYLSNRILTWSDTDQARCGIKEIFTNKNFSIEQYVDFALDVPSYFLKINNEYIDSTKFTFNQILNGQTNDKFIDNYQLSLNDWVNHLSTIFTEVRLKSYIEVRGADAGKWSMICALPAFWAGIFYDEENLNLLWHETENWSYADIMSLYADISKNGLKAKFQGNAIHQYCQYLLELSSKGLERRAFYNKSGQDEQIHLKALKIILNDKKTPADILLEETNNGNNLIELFDKPYY
jgi:glutamate--cysteine ligase